MESQALVKIAVRATLLFSSQRAAEHLLALTNPCWSLPIGCSLVHRGRIESTITLHPAKGEDMAMSATTTILASLIEGVPRRRNGSLKGEARPRVEGDGVRCDMFSRIPLS